ncbi:MAG: HYR domain-containing protein, partial [Ilumatobacteraceae bacterium]
GGGDYDISITVIDQAGGEATATTSVTVAATTGLLGARTLRRWSETDYRERPLIENTPGRFEVTATANDRVRVDWDDDGTIDATVLTDGSGVATFDTPAFDEGMHPTRVVVDSGDGTAETTEVFPIDVVNALPTDLVVEVYDPASDTWRAMPEAPVPGAARDGRPTFHEGDIVHLRMSATDVGNDQLTFAPYHKVGNGLFEYDTQTVVDVDGDGVVETSFRIADQLEFTSSFFGFPPAVLVSVTDSDTWITSETGTAFFHIDNLPPVVEHVDQDADDQGGVELRALVSDPGRAIDDITKVEIDWGDGSDIEHAALGLLGDDDIVGDPAADIVGAAAHRYAAPGTYTAWITAHDDVTSTPEMIEIVVPPFAPVIGDIVELDVGAERTPTRLAVMVGDSDSDLEELTVTVDWGNGTTSSAQLETGAGGVGTFVATHTYAVARTYETTIHATDGERFAETSEGTLIVGDTAPSVTVEQAEAQADPTSGDVTFDVVFTESVTGFDASDVELSGSAGATTATITEVDDSTAYTVTVSGMTSTGTVIASLRAGAATDAQGSESLASVSTDNSVRFVAPMRVRTPSSATTTVDNDPGLAGAFVEFDITVEGGTGGGGVTCTPASGTFFPIGDTTVTCTASDAVAALTARATSSLTMPDVIETFVVTVRDVEKPALSAATVAPAPVRSTDGSPVAVTYTPPTITDNSETVTPVTCSHPSGSLFEVGSTTVTCSASDAAGNTLTTSFEVVVTHSPAAGEPTASGPDLNGELPETGSGVMTVVFRALALLLFGTMLVLSTRRRTTASSRRA